MNTSLTTVDRILIATALVSVIFFSAYKLFDSPETWMDEGLIIQAAEGILDTGKASLLVAPGVYEPAWYITTGFPVTLPLAGVFAVFGVSIEAARLVMLVFLLSFYIALWFYARKTIGGIAAWLGFFLLVFFGPIYGNGRNVLGEIPGLLIILIALWPLLKGGELTRKGALWVGIGAGLAVAAKPIFILFIPALLLSLFLHRQEIKLKKVFFVGTVGIFIPILIWVFFQFDHITPTRVLSVYANPHDLDISKAIVTNIKRFSSETQPLYFLAALTVWFISYILRRLQRISVSFAEETLLFFSMAVFFAYMRTAGYYRYFFPAQVFALLYLPQSLWYLVGRRQFFSRAIIISMFGFVLFQAYETTFRSWVAIHYNSTRTEVLERYFATLPKEEEIFVYQAPEVMSFVGTRPTYQYVEITPSIRAGSVYTHLVSSGAVQRILTPSDFFKAHQYDLFMRYVVADNIDSYTVAIPKTQ